MTYTRSFLHGDWEVVVEADDRTCYAYLLKEGKIRSDVWLTNRVAAPDQPEWHLPDAENRMPFLNSSEYVEEGSRAGETLHLDQLRADWAEIEDDKVALSLGPGVLAVLRAGVKPGWCARAAKDGPLAKRMA